MIGCYMKSSVSDNSFQFRDVFFEIPPCVRFSSLLLLCFCQESIYMKNIWQCSCNVANSFGNGTNFMEKLPEKQAKCNHLVSCSDKIHGVWKGKIIIAPSPSEHLVRLPETLQSKSTMMVTVMVNGNILFPWEWLNMT